jgi:hypothetical protein
MALKKYTQAGFDDLPTNENGGKICPTGDYTEIQYIPAFSELGDCCTLGNYCTLGKNISFESGHVKNGVYLTCGNIGSENRTAYFYADETGKFFVRAGCWFSDMGKFITRVKSVHGGTVYETQYLAACKYAKAALPAMLEKERTR